MYVPSGAQTAKPNTRVLNNIFWYKINGFQKNIRTSKGDMGIMKLFPKNDFMIFCKKKETKNGCKGINCLFQ